MNRCDVGDVVILDADNNTIETPFDDVHNLPSEVVSILVWDVCIVEASLQFSVNASPTSDMALYQL